jgi:lipopolysaccharide/colanic/teichoic acid biosynthesis glycosyltransferase
MSIAHRSWPTESRAAGSDLRSAVQRQGHPWFARLVKECWERTAALVLLILIAPVLVALVVAIRLESPGGAVFRQTRVGRDHRPFRMYKFRTMSLSAEAQRDALLELNDADGPLFKLRDDPRVTRIGRVLRRYSVDELPQLLNVVLGQMSLVGPRPPLPEEASAYEAAERRRQSVKPGLTGLWQVSGRSDLSWDESMRLDLRYVENWSLTLDVVIMLRTCTAVLRSSGAY